MVVNNKNQTKSFIKKLNWIFGLIIFIFVALGVIAYQWNHQKIAYANTENEITKLYKNASDDIRLIRKAYSARNQFVQSLIVKSQMKKQNIKINSASNPANLEHQTTIEDRLTTAILEISEFNLNTSEQLARFEQLNNYINQLLIEDIIRLNNSTDSSKKSNIFTDQQQVRQLERYDLAIDQNRLAFAQTASKFLQLKLSLEKNWHHKKTIEPIPYFPADVMVVKHQRKNKVQTKSL